MSENIELESTAVIGRVENDVVAELAMSAADPTLLDERGIWLAVTADGGREVIDLTETRLNLDSLPPLRKRGEYKFGSPQDFLAYLDKHAGPQTELWGSDKSGTVRAVIDAHAANIPGHEQHAAVLALPHTRDWTEWVSRDGQMSSQLEFAEFIEDHLPNFVNPSGADMLELAQSFQATNKVDFASSQRLRTGETELLYTENVQASAGKKGSLAIPDTFVIGVQVYERGPAYRVEARFRYRINGGALSLGYRLNRIDDVRRAAFDEVVELITAADRPVWHLP